MDTTISKPKHMIFKNILFNNNTFRVFLFLGKIAVSKFETMMLVVGKYEDFPYISKVHMSQGLE